VVGMKTVDFPALFGRLGPGHRRTRCARGECRRRRTARWPWTHQLHCRPASTRLASSIARSRGKATDSQNAVQQGVVDAAAVDGQGGVGLGVGPAAPEPAVGGELRLQIISGRPEGTVASASEKRLPPLSKDANP